MKPCPLAALFLLGFSSASGVLDHSPNWISNADLDYGLDYFLPEILDNTGAYVIPHDPYGYPYCRWGNLMERFSGTTYEITRLTRKPFENDLFLSWAENDLYYSPFPVGTLWPTISWPPSIDNGVGWAEIPYIDPPANTIYGTLFRYLHLRKDNLRMVSTDLTSEINPYIFDSLDFNYQAVPQDTEKLIILIHGWNPQSHDSGFFNGVDDYNGNFAVLTRAMQNALRGSDWCLAHYNWAADSDTGGKNIYAAVNGTEAAEIGTQHGWHLAKVLEEQHTSLRRVHLIAHSAGTWVTWAAAYYLLERNPDVVIQISFLDPFMPNSIFFVSSVLGVSAVDQFMALSGQNYLRLFQVENYWADDMASGTNTENFNFRTNVPNLEDVNFETNNLLGSNYYSKHGGPIKFYADTVLNTLDSGYDLNSQNLYSVGGFDEELYGWKRSMAYAEMKYAEAGFPKGLIFRNGLCYQQGFGYVALNSEGGFHYSYEHGHQRSFGNYEDGMFLYDESLRGYLFTNSRYFPFFYSWIEGMRGWLWYVAGGSPGIRQFYSYKNRSWISEEGI